ncbi:MAG: ATP-binding protein [Acidobacteria bacterium]|nr:ATP-binding protein [Acidobacteriota bacterium]
MVRPGHLVNRSVDGAPSGEPPRTAADLVVFIGLPASGKTTFYRREFASTHAHVSKDLMRNVRTRGRRQAKMVDDMLSKGISVVVDNTNVTRADRAALVAAATSHRARVVAYVFTGSPAQCLARNKQRRGKAQVSAAAILAGAKRFQPLTADEGFDAVYRVTIGSEGDFEVVRASLPASF